MLWIIKIKRMHLISYQQTETYYNANKHIMEDKLDAS